MNAKVVEGADVVTHSRAVTISRAPAIAIWAGPT